MKWGIDLGGTKIECIVLAESGDVLERSRVPTEASKGYEHVLNQIDLLLETVCEKVGSKPDKIGIGTPGSIDPQTGLLRNCNAKSLNDHPFQEDLIKKLKIPVCMANDANCFALAEYHMGSIASDMKDARVVFGIILGSGVGGGLIIDGEIHNGRNHLGGEWGQMIIETDGKDSHYGKKGSVEDYISGPALESFYQSITGENLKLPEIYRRYKNNNDPAAKSTMDRLLKYYGIAISNLINFLDPDAIILGGGVSNLPILYEEGLEVIRENIFGLKYDTPILKAKLGDSAGVYGAAYLT